MVVPSAYCAAMNWLKTLVTALIERIGSHPATTQAAAEFGIRG